MPVGISDQRSAEEKDNYYGKTSFPYFMHVRTAETDRVSPTGKKKWSTHPISSCAAHSFLLRRDRKKVFLRFLAICFLCVCFFTFPRKRLACQSRREFINPVCHALPHIQMSFHLPRTFVFPRFGISKFENMLRFTLRKFFGKREVGGPKCPIYLRCVIRKTCLIRSFFLLALLRSDYKRLTTHFPSFSAFVSFR